LKTESFKAYYRRISITKETIEKAVLHLQEIQKSMVNKELHLQQVIGPLKVLDVEEIAGAEAQALIHRNHQQNLTKLLLFLDFIQIPLKVI